MLLTKIRNELNPKTAEMKFAVKDKKFFSLITLLTSKSKTRNILDYIFPLN